jgi:hypothetical protein
MIDPKERASKKCFCCGTSLSVKYVVTIEDQSVAPEKTEVYMCNKCYLLRKN